MTVRRSARAVCRPTRLRRCPAGAQIAGRGSRCTRRSRPRRSRTRVRSAKAVERCARGLAATVLLERGGDPRGRRRPAGPATRPGTRASGPRRPARSRVADEGESGRGRAPRAGARGAECVGSTSSARTDGTSSTGGRASSTSGTRPPSARTISSSIVRPMTTARPPASMRSSTRSAACGRSVGGQDEQAQPAADHSPPRCRAAPRSSRGRRGRGTRSPSLRDAGSRARGPAVGRVAQLLDRPLDPLPRLRGYRPDAALDARHGGDRDTGARSDGIDVGACVRHLSTPTAAALPLDAVSAYSRTGL